MSTPVTYLAGGNKREEVVDGKGWGGYWVERMKPERVLPWQSHHYLIPLFGLDRSAQVNPVWQWEAYPRQGNNYSIPFPTRRYYGLLLSGCSTCSGDVAASECVCVHLWI